MSVQIPLQNKNGDVVAHTVVDAEDEAKVRSHSWYLSGVYAKTRDTSLHRFLLNVTDSRIWVDHINNDKLDNRRVNLRTVTPKQNGQNKPKRSNTSSEYTGVSLRGALWEVKCGPKYKGSYKIELHAAWAYNLAALEMYGEGAKVNKIEEPLDFVPWKRVKQESPYGKWINKISHREKQYLVKITISGFQLPSRCFLILDDAVKYRDKQLASIAQTKLIPKEIVKNEAGIAMIEVAGMQEWTLVDDEDYPKLMETKWSNQEGYVGGNIGGKPIRMHRLIMKVEETDKRMIDHINKIKTDNRKANLRLVTSGENNHNKTKRKGTSSQYIGVMKRRKKYEAHVSKNGKRQYLGSYPTEEIAGWVRDMRSKELYGDINSNGKVISM